MIWGTVSRDAKLEFTKMKNIPKVTFGVAYARKTFMNCLTLGDGDETAVAARLEKGDKVLCAGVWSSREYTTQEGEKKTWSELRVDMVIPQAAFSGETEEGPQGEEEAPEETGDYELSI